MSGITGMAVKAVTGWKPGQCKRADQPYSDREGASDSQYDFTRNLIMRLKSVNQKVKKPKIFYRMSIVFTEATNAFRGVTKPSQEIMRER